MSTGVREELTVPRCQYGVFSHSAYQHGYETDCGEPAIAKWKWPGSGEYLFVCAEHDAKVEAEEE